MLKFKTDVNQMLKDAGVTFNSVRKTKVISQGSLTLIKNGEVPAASIGILCNILKCQPGDIIEWIPDESEK